MRRTVGCRRRYPGHAACPAGGLLPAAVLLFGVALLQSHPARAACVFVPSAGNDAFVCDSGISAAGLTDLLGNNSLSLPAGGTGTLNGNVLFGSGTDRVDMNSGTIAGSVDQGAGIDAFAIGAGSVTGNVQQGTGTDDFRMTGGTIQSLSQGDSVDTFFMSGGHIVGFFEDGDRAVMTGGRIGRVDMKLDDNLFDMSGGTIDGNLVAGFGNDTVNLSAGSIGGNISLSGGTDRVTITGGNVAGSVLLSSGSDTLTWRDGGVVLGAIDTGPDNDVVALTNLTAANLGATAQFMGNGGSDSLVLDHVVAAGIGRFSQWESVRAVNGTELSFDGTLLLGDPVTGTGAFAIDASSTVFAGRSAAGVAPFSAAALVSVVNAGRIDLTRNGAPGDRFTVTGNYQGFGGVLALDTRLHDNASPSDRLVIARGVASGETRLVVQNAGGGGALTVEDGIMVVEAIAGGRTASGSFTLGAPVSAGAYEYRLFRGGLSAGSEQNWFLRSVLPPLGATVEQATASASGIPLPGPGVPPPTEGATPVTGPFVQLYRIEVPTYSVVPPLAANLGLSSLATFHERRGDQALLSSGALPTGWARVFGEDGEIQWSGTVSPTFDGTLAGLQGGLDLAGWESFGGSDRVGLLAGYANADGDVRGQALGWNNLTVGGVRLHGTSLGGYWTHVGSTGWYLDGVLFATWFGGDATSSRGTGIDLDGVGVTASLEGGYPVPLTPSVTFEPQAQLVWQHLDFDNASDNFSTVSFDDDSGFTGRIGLRLEGEFAAAGMPLRPYLKANLWKGFSGSQTVAFAGTPIVTDTDATALELGGGLVAGLTQTASLHLTADYTTNLGGEPVRIVEGNIGLTISW